MARDGYQIFDADMHIGPDAAILETYLGRAAHPWCGMRNPTIRFERQPLLE